MGIQRFLSSRAGKRFYNIAYCWGACLVILGAVFKIAHMPYDNVFLMIGLFTEVFIFFISGFDVPASDYKWDKVFPQLKEGDKSSYGETQLPDPTGELAARYAEQMKRLDENLSRLNEAYEEQIRKVSAGAAAVNPETFTSIEKETSHLVSQVQLLNRQYARMLEALNVTESKGRNK